MKILIVTEYFPDSADHEIRGGVEARSFYIARELAKKHLVTVLCSKEPEKKRENTINGIRVIRCGWNHSFVQGGSFLSRLSFLFSAIIKGRKIQADVIDGHNFITYIAAYGIALGRRIRLFATYNDVWIGEWTKNIGLISGTVGSILERIALRVPWTAIIAISHYTKNKLLARGISGEKIHVVPIGVAAEEYHCISAKKRPHPTVLYIGRLVEYKRVDDLIRAVGFLQKNIPDIQCLIIGSGPLRNDLEKLVNVLQLNDAVQFLGFVRKHEDVVRIMKESHVFCLPSLVEGFGMVTIEAMAAELPYVNSDIPATREVTENGKGGLLFKAGNVNDLAEKIIILLRDKELYKEKIKEGQCIIQKYNWKLIASEIERIYA